MIGCPIGIPTEALERLSFIEKKCQMPPRRILLNFRGNMPDTVNLVNHGSYNNRPHNRDASDVITLVIIRKGVKRNLGIGHLHKKAQFWIHHESKMLTVMVPTMLGV